MTIQYLLDEHVPGWWVRIVNRLDPDVKVWRVGDPGAPPLHSSDPVILEWCESHEFILVTNNRRSMPGHLANHLSRGRHVPGIFLVNRMLSHADACRELVLIASTALPAEYQDQIHHLPISS